MDDPIANAVYDRAGRHLTVYLSGELDQSIAPALTDDILRHIFDGDDVLWVDLSAVTFCGSAGVSLLARIHDRAGRAGAQMRLYNPPANVMRTIEVCGLADQFAVWAVTSN